MKTLALAATLLFACSAGAQQHDHSGHDHSGHNHPPAQPPVNGGEALQPLKPVPVLINPPFDRLAKLGPDGKVVRIDGMLDILAIQRNPLVDQATRERIRPVVMAWVSDIDRLTIDNLDFLEKIQPPQGGPGIIETVDINNQPTLQPVSQMMTQLMSAGPLSNHLELREVFTREQSARNQEIVSDYLQQVMNEEMKSNGDPNDQAAKLRQINTVSHFLFYMSCRDALESYNRQLERSAPIMDKVIDGLDLPSETKSKLGPAITAAKSAADAKARRKAAREVLNGLDFDQRRAALAKALEINGPWDPIAELGPAIPPPPNAGMPINTPAAPSDAAAPK